MTQTTNYNLNKFTTTDKLNPTTLNGLNDNADIIDTALASKPTATLVTTVTSSSTDSQVASAKAVYDNTPKITYSTTDIGAGATLADGTLYFVYE